MTTRFVTYFITSLTAFFCLAILSQPVAAQEQQTLVTFDMDREVEVRDVTPADFKKQGKKIVQLALRMSANFSQEESQVEQLVYRVYLDPTRVKIVDYLPRNDLRADIVSAIEIAEREGTETELAVSAGGELGASFALPKGVRAGVSAGGTVAEKEATSKSSLTTFKRLPSKQLVTAAGVENGRSSVYFKLRPFSQITLEGERDFSLLCEVDEDWQGRLALVDCVALLPQKKGIGGKKIFQVYLRHAGESPPADDAAFQTIRAGLDRYPDNYTPIWLKQHEGDFEACGESWFAPRLHALHASPEMLAGEYVVQRRSKGKLNLAGDLIERIEFKSDGSFSVVVIEAKKKARGELRGKWTVDSAQGKSQPKILLDVTQKPGVFTGWNPVSPPVRIGELYVTHIGSIDGRQSLSLNWKPISYYDRYVFNGVPENEVTDKILGDMIDLERQ